MSEENETQRSEKNAERIVVAMYVFAVVAFISLQVLIGNCGHRNAPAWCEYVTPER